jgi:DNA-binding NarL/FixJ family response regulator
MASLRTPRDPSPADDLTPREREILALVARGSSNQEIATELVISERTARIHVSNIQRKLDLRSRTQAALWASKHGFAPQDSTTTNP